MERTVQNVIETIIAHVPGAPFPNTVDTLKTGNHQQKVTAITVTFLATYEVIEQSIHLGANLIITHEPTFYNHLDETNWLKNDPVYQAKQQLIDQHGIAIWRFHDYLHALQPDPTLVGLRKALGWTAYALPEHPFVCKIPPCTLHELVLEIKSKLGLTTVRVVGDMQISCETIGLVVGAPGGQMQIETLNSASLDVLVCGEINEWETNEYLRDAIAAGQHQALIVIGHSASEEDGIREVTPWLQTRFPEIPITFIAVEHSLYSA